MSQKSSAQQNCDFRIKKRWFEGNEKSSLKLWPRFWVLPEYPLQSTLQRSSGENVKISFRLNPHFIFWKSQFWKWKSFQDILGVSQIKFWWLSTRTSLTLERFLIFKILTFGPKWSHHGDIASLPWDPYFDQKSKIFKMKISLLGVSSGSSVLNFFLNTLSRCLRRVSPNRTAISSQQNGSSRETKRGRSNFDPVFESYLSTLWGLFQNYVINLFLSDLPTSTSNSNSKFKLLKENSRH